MEDEELKQVLLDMLKKNQEMIEMYQHTNERIIRMLERLKK